ncbi:MAG: WYL domain-containing protein [Planctomycetes bacterium]|nr:WYL domain-containing protein [Planctomycetota bacterium]
MAKKNASDKTIRRLNRILAMIPYIRQHPNVKIGELAKVVGCRPSELLQDLSERVLLCGVPPYLPNDYIDVHIQGDSVRIRFAEHFKRPVRFTMQEALALKVMLSSVADSGISKGLLSKLDGVLSSETKRKVRAAHGRIGFLDHPMSTLQQVERALQARREIEIEYYTAGRDAMTTRAVRPYGTIFHHGFWYMVAYCRLRKKELPFRVDRIKSLRVLDSTYKIPKRFDLSRYEREEMYIPKHPGQDVAVRFDAELARWVKEDVPPGRIVEQEDGGIVLRLTTVHFEWLVRWLLPFGDHAQITSPPALKKRMREICEETLRAYKDP